MAQSAASVATADEAVCDDNKGQTENELNELNLDKESMMRDNFIKFADEKLNVKIMDHEILAIHKLPKRKNDTEPVLIKFSRNCTKRNLMKNKRKLKQTQVYMNDHLTKMNMDIEFKARQLRKENQLYSAWTINGKIFVKEKENSKKREIKHLNDLQCYV